MNRILLIVILLSGLCNVTGYAQNGAAFDFVENKGQWDQQVKFRGEIATGAFFLTGKGFTVLQHHPEDLARILRRSHSGDTKKNNPKTDKEGDREIDQIGGVRTNPDASTTLRSHAYNVRFEGAAENISITPDKAQEYYNNYFIGNDPSKWASHAKVYQAVLYKNVYPGIDVRYYSEYGQLKYDFIIQPGADPQQIAMRYEGADKLSIKNKELVVETSVATVKELAPYSYQSGLQGRVTVNCQFELVNSSLVRFKIKEYDHSKVLVIDPTVIFSTFTGGANNYGFTATPGPDGSFFSGSITFSAGFPTTPGAFQTGFSGGTGGGQPTDVGIIKFNPLGTARVYATYIGGNSNDFPHSLFCDPQGNLVVMGRTYSNNFPTTQNPLSSGGRSDIFITKLNAAGSALIGSLRIGGTEADGVNIRDNYQTSTYNPNSLLQYYGDESRSEVVMDAAGSIYVAAPTQSSDFPMVGTGFQTTKGAGQDGVVMKIDATCNNFIWTSFLGGNGDDGTYVLEINPSNGDIYVAGGTASTNLPATAGTIGTGYNGGNADGFVATISNNGSTLKKATYLGTNATDIVYGIKFDRLGFPYVMGTTRGNWTVTPATVWSNPGSKQFVAKLQPDLSAYIYSTVFGSGGSKPNMSPVAFLVDRCENVYISGWGGWLDNSQDPFDIAGVAGMPVTPDAIKRVTDNKDLYFIVIKKNATSQLYGSFFGQDGGEGEHVDGGTSRFDAQGVIYQAICANCFNTQAQIPLQPPGFPTTPGVVAPVNGTGNTGCNLAAIKISFNFAGVASGPKAFIGGVQDTVGCVPLTINFRDTVRNAQSYIWNFGDGSPDVLTNNVDVNHTYNAVGTYRVRLIAIDSNTCNIRDTAFITVRVRDDKANLAFTPVKLAPCEALSYRFDNFSSAPPGKPFSALSFTWDFGDGTRVTAGMGSVTHSYGAAGAYKVTLLLTDTNYCNAPDSISIDLRIAPNVDARFLTPNSGCAPYTAVFQNNSLAGQQFRWDFGDGNTSTLSNPVHLYNNVGTYRVKLIAIDSATCNIIDSAETLINVNPRPVADFSFAPVTPQTNKPTIFTNLATGGVRYKWLFGDGDSTVRTNTDTVVHQYNATGTYNACLIVYNQFNCTDTICAPVQAEVIPLLDVPNAFTPGRFGKNSVIRVEGFGIAKMTWRIYNRWGQKVFESNDWRTGWDGRFKGKDQPMDVYAYTLEVEFFDGTKGRKTGDITLIR